jgi:hypothetical protein
LKFLQPHHTADDALVAATKVGIPPAILPRIRVDGEGKILGVVLPGELGYDEPA